MANLSRTRTLFAFTSPRSIEKIIPEIKVLIDSFNGLMWNTDNQVKFFDKLFISGFYEGHRRPHNLALAARDRITRAPKALGFVNLKPNIELTEVGEQLLTGKRTNEIFTKQLLKFQLPSPYHKIPLDRDFNIKPYLELLRLINKVGKLSKTEIAIFFIQLTNYKNFENIALLIRKFREDVKLNKGNRKIFIDNYFSEELLKIYAQDIEENNIRTRENKEATIRYFIKTKKNNHLDYADAFIRYLRSTQLISFDKKTFRVIISPSRAAEVEYILTHINRDAEKFESESDFKQYLFSSNTIKLLTDDKEYIQRKLDVLNVGYSASEDINNLKDILEAAEIRKIAYQIDEARIALKNYNEFDDIIDVFKGIKEKEVPDPSLYLEWNIWRSMVMINYAKEVKGNFSIDLDGLPLNTALGNLPDIEIDYTDFKVIVEVTMSSGNKQYEMEGEPVARHFGTIQKSSGNPVYCLFVAPRISEGALAHFYNLNRFNTKAYGGKTRIIPMSLDQFISFITIAKNKGFNSSDMLKSCLDNLVSINQWVEDESLWAQHINSNINNWIS